MHRGSHRFAGEAIDRGAEDKYRKAFERASINKFIGEIGAVMMRKSGTGGAGKLEKILVKLSKRRGVIIEARHTVAEIVVKEVRVIKEI